MPADLGVTTGFWVSCVPDTHMSAYLHLHSGLYLGLCRYEGIRVKRCCPEYCVHTENVGDVLPVFDNDVGVVCLEFCREPHGHWY